MIPLAKTRPVRWECAVVGGGLVGLATAWQLLRRGLSNVVVLEKEGAVAQHQSGHNSGVIHSGLYYRPGSLKAENCVKGRRLLVEFCQEFGISHEICGKLVIATTPHEESLLDDLALRGQANGLQGITRLDHAGMRELEPAAAGNAALHVPETGVVDFVGVARVLVEQIRKAGGEVLTGWEVKGVSRLPDEWCLHGRNDLLYSKRLVNCAGLYSDRVARSSGAEVPVRILPFRGEYYGLQGQGAELVRHLIYPVPDPNLPFLGVHVTRQHDGVVEAGPNAVLATHREGYHRKDVSARDLWEMFSYTGTWHLARRFWRVGVAEYRRSFSRRLFLASLQRLVPALSLADMHPGPSGVRAQAVDKQGKLIDDFCIVRQPGAVHVLNAPSPAATACLSIGETVAGQLLVEGQTSA